MTTKNYENINYNIHDILTFQIKRKRNWEYAKDINSPYSYFETENTINPDIILNIGNFVPKNTNCYLVDYKWFIKDNYIYCSENIGKIKVDIEIIGLETTPTFINVSSNTKLVKQILLPSVLAQYVALRPMIDFKLLCHGYISIHAMAVANERGSSVFLGRGGSFKTTLAMDYTRKLGYKFLGDDRIIVNKKNVFSYPMHFRLFDYRINHMKTEDYSFLDKYKYLIYQKLVNDKPHYLIDSAPINLVGLIAKSNKAKVELTNISKTSMVKKTLISHKMENIMGPVIMGVSKGLYDYFTAYSYVFPNSIIANYGNTYMAMLSKYFNDDKYNEILLPKNYSDEIFDQFVDIVNNLKHRK